MSTVGKHIPERGKKHTQNMLRMILYICAAVMIAAGVSNGGMHEMMVKAVNICTECIGLG